MTEQTLANFKSQLNELRQQLAFSTSIADYAKQNPTSTLPFIQTYISNHIALKKLNYSGVVISLYGLFEEFIEESIEQFLVSLNNICLNITDLPNEVLKNHTQLSLTLISKIEYPKYKDKIKLETVSYNLTSCLKGYANYHLNVAAFSCHSANIRLSELDTLFVRIGISNIKDKIKSSNIFLQYLRQNNLQDGQFIFDWVDDMAERRNQIAHTYSSINDILSNDLLLEKISAVDVLSSSVYQILSLYYYKKCIHLKNSNQISSVVKVFNNSIIAFQCDFNIKIGDIFISKNALNKYTIGKIVEIQQNHTAFVHVLATVTQPQLIAIRIDTHVNANHDFFIIST